MNAQKCFHKQYVRKYRIWIREHSYTTSLVEVFTSPGLGLRCPCVGWARVYFPSLNPVRRVLIGPDPELFLFGPCRAGNFSFCENNCDIAYFFRLNL